MQHNISMASAHSPKTIYLSSTQGLGFPGGGGTEQMFIRGGGGPLYTLLYIIFHQKGTPFVYPLLTKS